MEDCPLALCDGSTIRCSDLVICDNIQKTRLGETLLPLYNPDAKWYYLNSQHNDEVTVIKIFDSDADVAASCLSISDVDIISWLIDVQVAHVQHFIIRSFHLMFHHARVSRLEP